MNDETMLPCPFCGGAAVVVGERHDRGGFYITCSGVGCQCAYGECYDRDAMPDHQFAEAADAIAAWNTRAQASAPEGEAVAEVVEVPTWQENVTQKGARLLVDLPAGTRLFTRSNAKAGEAELAAEYTRGRCDGWDAREAKAGEVWRPIETAPKDDEEEILGWSNESGAYVVYWKENFGWCVTMYPSSPFSTSPFIVSIDYWMPLPEPPTHDKTKA